MAQDYESIGNVSPALDRLVSERPGWEGDPGESVVNAQTGTDFSRYDRRSDLQGLGRRIPNMAGYHAGSIAEHRPDNFASDPDGGIIQP